MCICKYIYNACIHTYKLQPSFSMEAPLSHNFSMACSWCLTKRHSPSAVTKSMVLTLVFDAASVLRICASEEIHSADLLRVKLSSRTACEAKKEDFMLVVGYTGATIVGFSLTQTFWKPQWHIETL